MRVVPSCAVFARWWISTSVLTLLLLTAAARAQVTGEEPPSRLGTTSVRPLLVEVRFEGNDENELDDRVLQAQIRSKPTDKPGLVTRIFGLFQAVYDANPVMPQRQKNAVRDVVDSLRGEVRYFNPRILVEDTTALRIAYNSFGYHDAQFDYRVEIDTARNRSRIVFLIEEGSEYTIEGVHYLGLDDVPEEVVIRFEEPIIFDFGDEYREQELMAEASRVAEALQNEGYPFATPTNRHVLTIRDSLNDRFYDSALVAIYTGNRYVFGETRYLPDDESEGPPLNPETVLRQIEYSEGEFYSRRKVDQTLANLYGLGVFEYVLLDSLHDESTDSVLAMQLRTVLRDPRELSFAPEFSLERRGTKANEPWHPYIGLSASFTHANLFGGAEKLSLQGRVRSSIFESDRVFGQWTGGLSAAYLEPNFLGRRRWAFQLIGTADYAIEDQILALSDSLNDVPLRSLRLSFTPELSIRLPRHTAFTSVTGRLRFQWLGYQGVREYLDALINLRIQQARRNGVITEECSPEVADTAVRRAALQLYQDQVWLGDDPDLLENEFVRENFNVLKISTVASALLTGDKRDDFFAPRTGYYIDMRAEFGMNGLGHSGWAKLDVPDWRIFFPMADDAVFGGRAHFGLVVPYGGIKLVPATSRYWAGGPNSIRGWGPRELLISRLPARTSTCADPVVDTLLFEARRLVGGLMIIELMSDYRWRPFALPGVSLLQRQINKLMFIPSIDAGGAFFRDYDELESTESVLGFVLSNIGISVGLAVGYDTPIGPIRIGVGLPLWDPARHGFEQGSADERAVWKRDLEFRDIAWYFAIGHAF